MKIKSIIEELLANHERGSTEYLAGYILRMSDGRLGQSQAQQYASMFNEYAQFIYNPDSYTGIYKKVLHYLNIRRKLYRSALKPQRLRDLQHVERSI